MTPSPRPSAHRLRPLIGAIVLALAIAVAGALLWRSYSAAQTGRANVLLVVADDMRFDSLWVMESLNGLAQRGVTFTNAYVTTPLCCPSRASILTGLYARHHGVLENEPPMGGFERFDDRSTLATWLQSSGVRTGLVGRYLNGYESTYTPPGWDFWFGLYQSANYNDYHAADNGVRRSFGSSPRFYSTTVLGEQAKRFLAEEVDRPFMLLVTPRAPHAPATPAQGDGGRFRRVELALPPSFNEPDMSDKPPGTRETKLLSADVLKELETLRRRQLESLLSLDRVIDDLVETLRADGRLERTWIIFSSDNGLALGEHRIGAAGRKSCPYEECIRVPLVVIPPGGLAEPRTDDRLVANIDLAPTIAAIMGVEPNSPVDGRSFLPLLADPAAPWREGLVFEQWDEEGRQLFVGVRTADRKYTRYPSGNDELYNETADPYELESLDRDPAWAPEKDRLGALLNKLLDDPSTAPSARARP